MAYTNYLKIVLESFHDKNFRLSVGRTRDSESFVRYTMVITVEVNLHKTCLWSCHHYDYYNNPLPAMVVGLHTPSLRMTVRNRCFSEYTGLTRPESVASRDKKYAVVLAGTEHPEDPSRNRNRTVRRTRDSAVQKADRTRTSVAEERRIPVLVAGRTSLEAVVRSRASAV